MTTAQTTQVLLYKSRLSTRRKVNLLLAMKPGCHWDTGAALLKSRARGAKQEQRANKTVTRGRPTKIQVSDWLDFQPIESSLNGWSWSLAGRPRPLIGRPRPLVGRPGYLVGRPRPLFGRPRSLFSRPESLKNAAQCIENQNYSWNDPGWLRTT